MRNLKKHKTRTSGSSIDGFIRRTKTSTGIKPNIRSGKINSYADNRVVGGDPSSFPGLKSTFRKSTSESEIAFEDILDDIDHPTEKSRSRRLPRLPGIPSLRLVKSISLISLLIVVLGGGYFGAKGYLTSRKIFTGTSDGAVALNRGVDPSLVDREGDGRINLLLLGKGGDSHDGGELTDSIVVASIDPFQKKAALLSIPRDLYVDAPGLWSMKVNAVYNTEKRRTYDEGGNDSEAESAGLDKVAETISETIGIPIHYYSMFDFDAVESAVDAIGGLEIDVKDRLYDTNFLQGGYLLDIDPGPQVFDGTTTLFYVRSRYSSPRGDFDRSERQREVLIALKDQVLSVGTFANPIKANEMIDVLGDNLQTNMSINEAFLLYDIVKEIQPQDVSSLSLVDDPVLAVTGFVGDQSVVLPKEGLSSYSEIQAFVRNQLLDGFLGSEQATVTVLNGSGLDGYAGRKASELESFGYKVDSVQDAPTSDYLSSVIINVSGGSPYTERYLEQRFGSRSVGFEPRIDAEQYGTDFVIIVGANESFN